MTHASCKAMFDIIGDVHGYADELVALLERLGYERHGVVYAHPDRTALFVGDFIDRGPKIGEVLHLVRSMLEAGAARAVMGNHEFNAIAYHTPDPKEAGQHLRRHSPKNIQQHHKTVEQVPAAELAEWIDWFRTLPLALELPGMRVVHACWDPVAIELIEQKLAEHRGVLNAFMAEASADHTDLFRAVENVLKGPELELPTGSYRDEDGHERKHIRTRWFEAPEGRSFAEYALPRVPEAPDSPVPDSLPLPVPIYPSTQPPVLFGHYWLQDTEPGRLAPNVACVDYSVALDGKLCAYRWSGEQVLRDENFVTVRSESGRQRV